MDDANIGNGRMVTRTRLESLESLMGADMKPDFVLRAMNGAMRDSGHQPAQHIRKLYFWFLDIGSEIICLGKFRGGERYTHT